MRRRAALALAALAAWAQDPVLVRTPSGPAWQVKYLHDEDATSLRLNDLQISGTCILALGSIYENATARTTGTAVRSVDGGRTWELVSLAEVPRTGFLSGVGSGWMVTASGIWKTADCGKGWEKIATRENLLRVRFVDSERGFAVGTRKQALETRDGGRTWSPVAGLADIGSAEDRSSFHWIDFANPRFGMMIGGHEPRRPEGGRRRQLPSLLLTLQTVDGGETWKGSTASILGRVSRVRLAPDGSGLAIVEFQDEFEWPSEVYKLDPAGNSMVRVYREKDRAVNDAVLLADGRVYIAAIEPPGSDWHLPQPGTVRIARSTGASRWEEMPVDYRAVASRVMLAALPGGPVFAATDAGMILELAEK